MCEILEVAINTQGRLKLGSLSADLGRQSKLSDAELAVFERTRDKNNAQAPGLG